MKAQTVPDTRGLVPGIHVFLSLGEKDVDGRDKPGHDDRAWSGVRSHRPGGPDIVQTCVSTSSIPTPRPQ